MEKLIVVVENEGAENAMEKDLFTYSATASGGVEGKVQSSDNVINMITVIPGSQKEENLGNATNAEQLLAAGFATCFNSALQIVSNKNQVKLESEVTAQVSLFELSEEEGYGVKIHLEVKSDNVEKSHFTEIVQQANEIWPFAEKKIAKTNITIVIN